MPKKKAQKNIKKSTSKIGVALLMFGLAFAALYVSSQLTSRESVSPTAPESKPEAKIPEEGCSRRTVGLCGNAGGCGSSRRCKKNLSGKYVCKIDRSCKTTKINQGCVLGERKCIGGPETSVMVCVPTMSGVNEWVSVGDCAFSCKNGACQAEVWD